MDPEAQKTIAEAFASLATLGGLALIFWALSR